MKTLETLIHSLGSAAAVIALCALAGYVLIEGIEWLLEVLDV
jgi:hypothetical protein